MGSDQCLNGDWAPCHRAGVAWLGFELAVTGKPASLPTVSRRNLPRIVRISALNHMLACMVFATDGPLVKPASRRR